MSEVVRSLLHKIKPLLRVAVLGAGLLPSNMYAIGPIKDSAPFIGMSAYSAMAPEFPWRKWLSQYPRKLRKPAMATLWGSFGTETTAIREFCKKFKDRKHVVEIHISNECSRRSGRDGKQILPACGVFDYSSTLENSSNGKDDIARTTLTNRIKRIAAKVGPVINENTILWLSSGLEIIASQEATEFLNSQVKSLSGLKVVYNPVGAPAGRYGADLIEYHSDCNALPPLDGDIFNFDGCSIDAKEGETFFRRITTDKAMDIIESRLLNYRAIFLWSASQQGMRNATAFGTYEYKNRWYVINPEAIAAFKKMLLNLDRVTHQ